MATAAQSTTLNAILDAVGTVLVNGDGTSPGTGLNENYVQEAYSGYRPRSGEPYEITYGIVGEQPEMYSGAGRMGHDNYLTLQVTVYTRLETDVAGSDYQWSRDTTYGALVMRTKVQDVLQDNFLYSSYNAVTHVPDGTPITIEGLQQLPSPRPVKPDRDTTSEGLDVTYGEHNLFFQVKTKQPLTT